MGSNPCIRVGYLPCLFHTMFPQRSPCCYYFVARMANHHCDTDLCGDCRMIYVVSVSVCIVVGLLLILVIIGGNRK